MLGVIADDLTGAMDAAGLARRQGVAVSAAFGLSAPARGAQVHVCALKIRSVPASQAIEQARKSGALLWKAGASQLFYKYCSTFDSTPAGNIGPVALALAEASGARDVVFAPTFPENQRTVYLGHLFAGDRLLSESSLATHPLNPMTDPDLVRWLALQSEGHAVVNLPLAVVEAGEQAIAEWRAAQANEPLFIIADALFDRHLDTLAAAYRKAPLNTGGSAYCGALAALMQPASDAMPYARPAPGQKSAVIAGSCSQATLAQLERLGTHTTIHRLDPAALAAQPDLPEQLATQALASDGPAVIASTATPDAVACARGSVGADVGEQIEQALGRVAVALEQAGVTRFVVAGGETSGAVGQALGVETLDVGEEIAPGVPWVRDADDRARDFAFKSGNFGGPDFFLEALA